MSIRNPRQLENTRRKLAELEEHYAAARARPVTNALVRQLTLRSLKSMINQLKEEIAVYRAHAHAANRD